MQFQVDTVDGHQQADIGALESATGFRAGHGFGPAQRIQAPARIQEAMPRRSLPQGNRCDAYRAASGLATDAAVGRRRWKADWANIAPASLLSGRGGDRASASRSRPSRPCVRGKGSHPKRSAPRTVVPQIHGFSASPKKARPERRPQLRTKPRGDNTRANCTCPMRIVPSNLSLSTCNEQGECHASSIFFNSRCSHRQEHRR